MGSDGVNWTPWPYLTPYCVCVCLLTVMVGFMVDLQLSIVKIISTNILRVHDAL